MTYRIVHQVSSGGVIARDIHSTLHVCLIAVDTDRGRVWCLPKGHEEGDEKAEACAVREIREETGLVGETIKKLESIKYCFVVKEEHLKCFKTVHFYLLRYISGDPSADDMEVAEAQWLPIDEAMTRIHYENERRVLKKAQQYLQDTGPPKEAGSSERGTR